MCRFKKKKEMGICPKCGSDHNQVTDSELDFYSLWTEWSCKDCGETWSEYYKLAYDGYATDGKYYDAEGEEADI